MFRRRLFAYTIAFAAGITCGCIILEKCRVVCGLVFMAGAASAVFFAEPDQKSAAKDRIIIVIMILSGFLLFSVHFICYETPLVMPDGSMIDPHDSEAVESITCITGRISSVSIKNDDAVLIINTKAVTNEFTDEIRGIRRIQARIDAERLSLIVGDYYPDAGIEIITGRIAELHGTLRVIDPSDDPGCFDYRLYMRTQGIRFTFKAEGLSLITGRTGGNLIAGKTLEEGYWKYRRFILRQRESFLDLFDDKEISGFIRGMIFGDKSEIDEETLEEFNGNSTGHVLAVSGLHIGFLYALLRVLSGKRRNKTVTVSTVILIILYGEMTLWSASTVRAVIVLTLSLLSFHLRRRADLLTSVSAAAFIILLFEPYQLFSTGFQMTFLALTGISFLTAPIAAFTGEAFAVMLAVQLSIVPLTAYAYSRFNPLSMLINIPVITLASVIIPFIIIILYLYIMIGNIPHFLISAASMLTGSMISINDILAFDGDYSFMTSGISALFDPLRDLFSDATAGVFTATGAGILLLYYSVLMILSSEWTRIRLLRTEKDRIKRAFACMIIPVIAFGAAFYNGFTDDEIVFVSVGQGDCTHIRTGSHDILIDGGGSTFYNVGEKTLMPYLLKNGAEDIDMAFVTHLHTDHYLGISQLSDKFTVKTLVIPSDYKRATELLKKKNAQQIRKKSDRSTDPYDDTISGIESLIDENIEYADPGSRIRISRDVFIDVIWPCRGMHRTASIDDPNENNTVYMVNYKGIKIMVTGDLLEEDEHKMVERYRNTDVLKCDILKVAHHGSRSSTCDAFLDAAAPDAAVIQVGKNNFYGHPHQETVEKLEKRGIPVFRTDKNGAVGVDILRNGRISIHKMM